MSQPTRARTTGGARTRRKHPDTTGALPSSAVEDVSASPADTNALAPRSAVGVPPAAPISAELPPITPQTLARTLRAVAAEMERDPALAHRVAAALAADTLAPTDVTPAAGTPVGESAARPRSSAEVDTPPDASATPTAPRLNRAFRPRLVTGVSPALGTGIPDPFALYSALGADGLRDAIDELRLGTLRAIIREHNLDPNGTLARQHDAARLRAAILAKVITE